MKLFVLAALGWALTVVTAVAEAREVPEGIMHSTCIVELRSPLANIPQRLQSTLINRLRAMGYPKVDAGVVGAPVPQNKIVIEINELESTSFTASFRYRRGLNQTLFRLMISYDAMMEEIPRCRVTQG